MSAEAIDVRRDIRAVIESAILDHPRSLQAMIGPSELGTPCPRKLVYKLARTGGYAPRTANWRPTVGTAVHSWLEKAFRQADPRGERWQVELRVRVGFVAGEEVWGTADLFDPLTGTVVDWKIAGKSALDTRRRTGRVSDTYRSQLHLYGMGCAELGFDVKTVMIVSLPASGELSEAVIWQEPYTPAVAQLALDRAEGLAFATRMLGLDALVASLPMVEDYCRSCEFRDVRNTGRGCPGIIPGPPAAMAALAGVA